MRWLLTLNSDTGIRIAKAAGLFLSNIILGPEIPYIDLKTNSNKHLRTKVSTLKKPQLVFYGQRNGLMLNLMVPTFF